MGRVLFRILSRSEFETASRLGINITANSTQ